MPHAGFQHEPPEADPARALFQFVEDGRGNAVPSSGGHGVHPLDLADAVVGMRAHAAAPDGVVREPRDEERAARRRQFVGVRRIRVFGSVPRPQVVEERGDQGLHDVGVEPLGREPRRRRCRLLAAHRRHVNP